MEIEVQIINAFIDVESGGNPAGVVLDADEFSAQQKLKIGLKLGFQRPHLFHLQNQPISNSIFLPQHVRSLIVAMQR
jgi:predicted PhzF superfamily epimerase YddE/YHI9